MNADLVPRSQAEVILWRRHHLPVAILDAVRRKPRGLERLVDVVAREEKKRAGFPLKMGRRNCRIWTVKHLQDLEQQSVLFRAEGHDLYLAKAR